MKKLTYLVILMVWLNPIFAQSNYYPDCDGELIEHTHYTICYNETYEQASWVGYELTKSEVTNNGYDRTDNFQSNNNVESFTGIDFFYAHEDDIEQQLGSEYDVTDWTFSSGRSYSSSSSSSKKYYSDKENKIKVNTATASQLDQLYGIGPAKAKAIIDARPYRSVDDLTRAKGIGPKTLEDLRPYVTVK